LEVVLSAEGRIKAVKIVRGAPYGLNAAAVDAVSKWKLDPAMREGQPLDVSFPIEVILRLF